MIVELLIKLSFLFSVCSSVSIAVGVNDEMRYAIPFAGKSMLGSAQLFCRSNGIEDPEQVDRCIEGVNSELTWRSEAAFLSASTEAGVDNEMYEVNTLVGEDPTSAAIRWCDEHNIHLKVECSHHLSEELWEYLEYKHRIRLEDFLEENPRVYSLPKERQDQRLEEIRGSIAVLRLRVKLTHSLKATTLESLGLAELLLGFNRRGEGRLLQALSLDPHLELARDILDELSSKKIDHGEAFRWRVQDRSKSIDQIAEDHMTILRKRSGSYGQIDCSIDGTQGCPVLRHRRSKLVRISMKDIERYINNSIPMKELENNSETIAAALKGEIPFVLIDAMDGWDWSPQKPEHSRWNYSDGRFLENNPLLTRIYQKFKNTTIEFFPGGIGTLDQFNPHMYAFGDAVDQLDRPRGYQPIEIDTTNEGAYVHWGGSIGDWKKLLPLFSNKEIDNDKVVDSIKTDSTETTRLYEDIENSMLPDLFGGQVAWMEECLLENGDEEGKAYLDGFVTSTRWFAAYVGEAGGGMFNHQDNHRTSAWQAQVQGVKRWHLCSPDQSHLMNGRGGIDVFNPDYEDNPQFLNVSCYDDVVNPGEMIFYPGQFWHSTQTLSSPTVSLSSLLVDASSWKHIRDRMREVDCGGSSKKETTNNDGHQLPPNQEQQTIMVESPSKFELESQVENGIAVDSAFFIENKIGSSGDSGAKQPSFPPKLCARLEHCFTLFERKFLEPS